MMNDMNLEVRVNKMEGILAMTAQNVAMTAKTQNDTSTTLNAFAEYVSMLPEDYKMQFQQQLTQYGFELNQKIESVNIAWKNEIEDIKEKVDLTRDMVLSNARVSAPSSSYFPQSDFGDMFRVSISSNRVGRLLKAVGLAKKSKGKTVPYDKFKPKYAKTVVYENKTAYEWHYKNCLKYIEEWLNNKGLLEEFYTIESREDMVVYIDRLYSENVI